MAARPRFAARQVAVDHALAAAGQLQKAPLNQIREALLLIGVALEEALDHGGLLDLIFHAVPLGKVHVFQNLQLLQIGIAANDAVLFPAVVMPREGAQPCGIHVVLGDQIKGLSIAHMKTLHSASFLKRKGVFPTPANISRPLLPIQ